MEYLKLGPRLASMFVDHLSISILTAVIGIPVMLIDFFSSAIFDFDLNWITAIFISFIYLNKDYFRGKSLAKRIFGFQVMKKDSDEVASRLQCLLRNLTIFVWPLEVIFTVFSTDRRIGDYIANTRIVISEKEEALSLFEEIRREFGF